MKEAQPDRRKKKIKASFPLYHSIRARANDHSEAIQGVLDTTPVYSTIETLLAFWNEIADIYQLHDAVSSLAPLCSRALQDFEAGVFLFDNGLYGAMLDLMRDLMEIGYLFRHFAHEPASIEQWLGGTEETWRNDFSANALRIAEAKRRHLAKPSDLSDAADYKGHSRALHVTPKEGLVPRGFATTLNETLVAESIALFELLEHGRRTGLQALEFLKRAGVECKLSNRDLAAAESMIDALARFLNKEGFPIGRV